MKPSTEEFDRWLALIPEDFDPHFVPVRREKKSPDLPKGHSWKNERHRFSREEARTWLEEGGNIGFVARKDLAVMDIDDRRKAENLLENRLWNTLTVSTRSGGNHLYFVNGGVENSDVPEVIEVRANWRYVLAPGSFVDPGNSGGNGLYQVAEERPPRVIFPEDLPPELEKTGENDLEPPAGEKKTPGPFENRHGWSLEEIREEDWKLDELLSGQNPYGYPSTSEADFATCVKLLYWDFKPEQCVQILRKFRTREKILARPEYVGKTVASARKKVDRTISDDVDVTSWWPGSVLDRVEVPEGGGRNHASG